MACRSSEWMIKNTGRIGHLHSTTFYHARNSGPLSVVIGLSSLNTIIHRTRLPVSSTLNAFLIIVVNFPSNLLKRTIDLTRPHPHLQSYRPPSQVLRGSQAHSGQWQHSSSNEFDGLGLRKWEAPCSSKTGRAVCVDRIRSYALCQTLNPTLLYGTTCPPGLIFNKFVCTTKATKMNKDGHSPRRHLFVKIAFVRVKTAD
jgi:hypothetical protein